MDLKDIIYAHSKFGTEHNTFIHIEAHCGIQGYNITLSNTAHATSVPAHCI